MTEETTQSAVNVPQFLKVLFILSFIGIGLQILGNIMIIGTTAGIIGVASALGCLFGVLQMKKLKKTGFYIYTVCEILPTVYGLITLGSAMFAFGGLGGGIMAIYAFLSALFPILFIILYAVNLKHLK